MEKHYHVYSDENNKIIVELEKRMNSNATLKITGYNEKITNLPQVMRSQFGKGRLYVYDGTINQDPCIIYVISEKTQRPYTGTKTLRFSKPEKILSTGQTDVVEKQMERVEKQSYKIITDQLDHIADSIQPYAPKIALAIDLISDQLERRASSIMHGRHKSDQEIEKKFQDLKKNPMGLDRLVGDIEGLAEGDDMEGIAKEFYPGWGIDDFKLLLDKMNKELE